MPRSEQDEAATASPQAGLPHTTRELVSDPDPHAQLENWCLTLIRSDPDPLVRPADDMTGVAFVVRASVYRTKFAANRYDQKWGPPPFPRDSLLPAAGAATAADAATAAVATNGYGCGNGCGYGERLRQRLRRTAAANGCGCGCGCG
jgi:hypothetical protein